MNQTMKPKEVAKVLKPYVENLLAKKLVAQTLREEVDKIQREVLAIHAYHGEHGRILDPNDSYKIINHGHYYQTLHDTYTDLGYTLKDVGYCPACIAESDESDAERELIEQAEPFFSVASKMLILSDKREKYLDLLIGLVLASERENDKTRIGT